MLGFDAHTGTNAKERQLKDFRNLLVWQKAHELTLLSYKSTAKFPHDEHYGLTTQIRRCSASIGANIAEGCGRFGNAELHRFMQIAMGSVSELDYHFVLAHDLGFLDTKHYELLNMRVQELKRMLVAFVRKVASDRQHGPDA